MGKLHLVAIDEEQIRDWAGTRSDLITQVGGAMVLACTSSPPLTVQLRNYEPASAQTRKVTRLSIQHLGTFECDEPGDVPSVVSWSRDGERQSMDLAADDVQTMIDLVERMGSR